MIYNPAFLSQFKQRYGDFGPNRLPPRQPIFGPNGPNPTPLPQQLGNDAPPAPPQFLGPPIHQPPSPQPTEFGSVLNPQPVPPNPTTATSGAGPDGVMTTQPPSQLFANGGVARGFQIGGARPNYGISMSQAFRNFNPHGGRGNQAAPQLLSAGPTGPTGVMTRAAAETLPIGDSGPPPAGSGDGGFGTEPHVVAQRWGDGNDFWSPNHVNPSLGVGGDSAGHGFGPDFTFDRSYASGPNGEVMNWYNGPSGYNDAFPEGSNYNGLGALYGHFGGMQGGPGATGAPGPGGAAVMAAHYAHQFAHGGRVPGRTAPMSAPDTVPAMLKPGELILNQQQQRGVMIRPGMKNRLRPDEVSALYAAHMKR